MSFVGLDINDENQCVVLLDLLHRAFGVERVYDDLVFIQARLVRDRLPGVFGLAGELESLGSMECCRETDLPHLASMYLYTVI